MKVHPLPKKRTNFSLQFRDPSSISSHKKLRRLPHIFTRVLELPFRSDANVSIEENPDCFKFVVETDDIGGFRANLIEIHPGVMKIVVRPNELLQFQGLDDLELDMWRFRLPETTRPELASAVFVDGELVVTVPKGEEDEEEDVDVGDGIGNDGGSGRLVLVQ